MPMLIQEIAKVRRAAPVVAALLASIASAHADDPAERAASVLASVCLRAESGPGIMAAGEGAARSNNWSLNAKQSGPQKGLLPIGKNKAVAILWRRKVWDFVGHDGTNGSLSVQILTSGTAGQRFDSCQVAVPGDVAAEVEAAIGRKVSLATRASLPANASVWVLAGDMARPDQGYRVLGISTQALPGGKRRVTAAGVLDLKVPGAKAAGPEEP